MQKRPSSMPINIERPQSALLRGVKITEFKDHVINPDPLILQETDFLLEEFLSPTKLKALTGVDDLHAVDNLEMVVDTSETSLGNFGIYLPNLKQLKLNSSFVPRIRDLGTSLGHLKVLWLARSSLSDLDGIPALNNLQELYLAYNEIQDLSPCSMLENLKILDLEGNLVEDIRQVEFLSLCSNLSSLTLEGNPICVKPNPETQPNAKYHYRREVIKMLPYLKTLDDELTKDDKIKNDTKKESENQSRSHQTNNQCPFEDDWQLINQCLEEGVAPSEDKLAINECRRPGTASSHGSSPIPNLRPLSAMRPLSSCRPGSAIQKRPMSGSRLSSANANNASNQPRPYTDPLNDAMNDASELTIGPTLHGNPLRGLLARRKVNPMSSEEEIKPNKKPEKIEKVSNKNKNEISGNYEDDPELFKELRDWKKEHERKLEERKKYFEPQVLRIDDYAEPVLSDNNDEDEIEDDFNNEYEVEDELLARGDEPIRAITKTSKDASNNSQYLTKEATIDIGKHHSKKDENKILIQKKSHNIDENIDSSKRSSSSKRISSASSVSSAYSSQNESAASSRIPTGDTGYASISDVSMSSLSSKLNLKTPMQPSIQANSVHQPVIVSSVNSQTATKTSSPAAPTSNKSLKQLKSNLTPLSGLKFMKN